MSRKSVVLPRGLVAVRPRVAIESAAIDVGGADSEGVPSSATELPSRSALPAIDLKAVQRRAYERGVAHALEQKGGVYDGACDAMAQAASSLREARNRDAQLLSDFAVRLACSIASELVATTVDAEEHDVRGMVRRVLEDAMPDLGTGEVTLEGHPEDLALLPSDLSHGAKTVNPQPDPALPRGAYRVVGGDAEFYSGLSERLDAIRDRLIREATDGPA